MVPPLLSSLPCSHPLSSGSSPGVVSPHSRRSARRLESSPVSAANHSGEGGARTLDRNVMIIGSSSNPIQPGP